MAPEVAVTTRKPAATRWQIVEHLLVENALLALAGGALGVVVAAAAIQGLVAFAPPGVPLIDTVKVSTTTLPT